MTRTQLLYYSPYDEECKADDAALAASASYPSIKAWSSWHTIDGCPDNYGHYYSEVLYNDGRRFVTDLGIRRIP